MTRPIEKYIVDVLKRLNMNQSQLGDALGVNRAEITFILKKNVTPKDDLCIRLAKLAGDDPEKVLLIAAQSKAPKESQKLWADIFQKVAKASNFSLIFLFFFLLTVEAEASPLPSNQSAPGVVIRWILCQIRRNCEQMLRSLGIRLAFSLNKLLNMGCRYAGASCP